MCNQDIRLGNHHIRLGNQDIRLGNQHLRLGNQGIILCNQHIRLDNQGIIKVLGRAGNLDVKEAHQLITLRGPV